MKKLFIVLVIMCGFVSFAFASKPTIKIGVNAGFAMPFGTDFPQKMKESIEEYKVQGANVAISKYNAFNGGLNIKINPFGNGLKFMGFYSQLAYMSNNGIGFNILKGEQKLQQNHQYKTLDFVPFALTCDYNINKINLSFLLGLNLSFVLGDVDFFSDATMGNVVAKKASSSVVSGIVCGFSLGYDIGFGEVSCDAQYVMDTMTFEIADIAILLRKVFTLSLGYRYTFN